MRHFVSKSVFQECKIGSSQHDVGIALTNVDARRATVMALRVIRRKISILVVLILKHHYDLFARKLEIGNAGQDRHQRLPAFVGELQ